MSQFNFVNEINSVMTMEGEITRGPVPRWQKKQMEASSMSLNNSVNNTSRSVLSMSYNTSFGGVNPPIKTPSKRVEIKNKNKTPTPSKNTKTSGGDRFIPNRSTTNFDLGHYMVKQEQEKSKLEQENDEEGKECNKVTPSKEARKQFISDTLNIDTKTTRILSYREKAPAAPESHVNPLKVVYTFNTPSSTKSGSRYIPTTCERILDAPDIINDYYLNLLDWSADNIVTVALGTSVYLWNAGTGNIEQLVEYEEGDHACALSWIQDGQILAIGNTTGAVELWDCVKIKRLRVMDGHTARVGSLAWNSFLLSSGSRSGAIMHHDVRAREHHISTLQHHSLEVCGLRWSTDFRHLASGGNDNLVNVFSAISGGVGTGTEPLHTLNQHQAAVRALAWCPWQSNLLASGGGTADRCIKLWNVSNGALVNSVDSKSQVCALMWSRTYKELVSAHGFAHNQLTIWKYPNMVKQAELTGHTSRVLQLAMSPDGSTIISASADETLRLWNCFQPDPHTAKKSSSGVPKAQQSLGLHRNLR